MPEAEDRTTRRSLFVRSGAAAMAWLARPSAPRADADRPSRPEVGTFRRIYTPGPGKADAAWHVNDHAFVRGPDDLWHMFGIAWPDPGVKPGPPRGFLEHATSPLLEGSEWTRRDPVLELREGLGETVMWAPHVVEHAGTFYLFACTGGPDPTRWGLGLATSKDLIRWERASDRPLFRDGFQARDPMVIRLPEERKWVMYYTATEEPEGGRHAVAYRTSDDLARWSERRVAFLDDHRGTDYGPTESPFVVHRGGYYYLFLGPRPYDRPTPGRPNFRHPGYVGTDVFASRDWRSWTKGQAVGHIPAHAPEVVRERGDRWYVSHCGIAQGGLFLAPLRWVE